eukprot:g35700.t1
MQDVELDKRRKDVDKEAEEKQKWRTAAACLYLEMLVGLVASFPVFSPALKAALALNQKSLSWCSSLGSLGQNLSAFSGVVFDNLGPMYTSAGGVIIATCGFTWVYLVASGVIPLGGFGAAWGFAFGFQGLVWIDTAVISSMLRLFSADKGLAVGIVKAQYGLATSILIVLSSGLIPGTSSAKKDDDSLSSSASCEGERYIGKMTVGPNGAGKSTLLKLMCGDLTPTIGNVSRHIHLSLGRYHQHSADILDPEKEVLQFFMDSFEDKKLDRQQWRTYIGKYGVSGKMQLKKIGTLSDGQKTRVVFAMIALKTPNLLLLDEPTNHLDIPTIDSLAEAIKLFKGGVVLVSHDFRLIDQVAQTVWICDDKTVKEYQGDIHNYKNSLVKRMKKEGLL